MNDAIASSLSRAAIGCGVDLVDRREHQLPALEEQRVEHLVLGLEVVVDEPVGDAGLVGDVRDAAGVEALAREDADGRVEDQPALVDRRGLHARTPSAAGGTRPAGGWRATAASRGSPRAGRSRGRRRRRSRRPAPGEHDAPRVDDHRAPARCACPGACSPTWLAAITKHWSSIARARSRTSQWSRVVVSRERGRDGEELGARATARMRGRARGSAGRSRWSGPGRCRRRARTSDELVARRLVLGLAVRAAADLDVEHVDLAVDRAVLAVGPDVDARVRAALGALDALGDRAGDEVDAQLARDARAPRSSDGPSSGSAPAAVCSGVPSTGHFSGSTTSSAPRRGRLARQPVGRLEVAVAIGRGAELDGCGAHPRIMSD